MLLLNRSYHFVYFLVESQQDVNSAIAGLLFIIIAAAAYIFGSYCFYNIYQKLREPNAWFAWVPILSNWIMLKAGGQSPWWVVGMFIPIVNIVTAIVSIIAFVNIVKRLGKNPWLIWLMIIPLVNFIILYNFALVH